jgi:DNA-binding LytR/AlgR family response regulator
MNRTINCLIVDDEPIAREIIATHLSKLAYVQLVSSCADVAEAANALAAQAVDLIFLDINMPEVSGLSLAKAIGSDTKIIFTTAHREYAMEAFELDAVDYLLKPITFERLLKAINKYERIQQVDPDQDNHKLSASKKSLFVRADRKMVKVNYDDILYLESYSDYVKIHMIDQVIITRELISHLADELPSGQFIRIHRSFIVAIDRIKSYTNESVEIGNKELTISRSYKDAVLAQLLNH